MALPMPVRPEMVKGLSQLIAQYINDEMNGTKEDVRDLQGRVDNLEKQSVMEPLKRSQKREVQRAVGEQAHKYAKLLDDSPRKHYEAIYGSLKDFYDVPSYEELPRAKFVEIIQRIKAYDGSGRNWWQD